MRTTIAMLAVLLAIAACDNVPDSIANHPDRKILNIDDHKIYVVKQPGNTWLAAGGEEDNDGFVQYRQKRAIEVQSKCRIDRVLSAKGAPLLKVSVKDCR